MANEATLTGMHLFVRDVPASVAFYRRVGLEFSFAGEHFARAASSSGTSLEIGSYALTRGYDPGFREPAGSGSVALQLSLPSREAVDRLHAEVTSEGVPSHLAPFDAFWGSRYMEVLDPDGNVVGFHSPRDEGMISAPPAG